jgi:cyclic beta-1,2-glucan synthetase
MLFGSFRVSHWLSQKIGPCARSVELPLQAELFSAEQLVRHAQTLASRHQIITRRGANCLLARLHQNEDILRSFNRSTLAVTPNRRITPAAEWLLDNFYLIEEQIQLARRHLPRGYSQELPRLASGANRGLPRVYDIVHELISHVDAQIDATPLRAFIAAYQSDCSLTLGELWAIPIMLRLSLIDNLQRLTSRLVSAREDFDLADEWVDRLQDMAQQNPSHLVVVVADMAKSNPPLSSAFVTEFSHRLSQQSSVLHLARTWLEQRLAEQGLSIEQLVHKESQKQAADQVSVSHSIASLRFLGALDWSEFVEALSLVEKLLRTDPYDAYAGMDFPTRDRYRHAVEFFSRHSGLSEPDVAQQAIDLAAMSAQQKGRKDRTAHVGFYLLDKGRSLLGHRLKASWPLRMLIERGIHYAPAFFYAGGVLLLTGLATGSFAYYLHFLNLQGWGCLLLTPCFVISASQLAVAFMNRLSTVLVKPHLLPRMETLSGIATDSRTLVIIPAILSDFTGIDKLLASLELHYLANRDPCLHFGLLTDFRDANQEFEKDDCELLQRVRDGIEHLALKYSAERQDLFFLFHRPRCWNPGEQIWMGYERKRGKLMDLNALLRGQNRARFSEIMGMTTLFPLMNYIITLDADTQLPRDAARRLVGTMAHPLNHPVLDVASGIVIEGYSILQPRVSISLPSSRESWFVRLFSGDVGIDPYTREVSDVYQDVFGEGSFIGKGIYDIDAFQQAIKGRFPENVVLSHDLLEACYARSALVSDVELYENFPSRYIVDMDRRYRWIRGDWQIAQWLFSWVPSEDGRRKANTLSWLSQWKILDNLRRSLVPAALLFLLEGGWLIFPLLGPRIAFLVIIILVLPSLLSLLALLLSKSQTVPYGMHGRAVVRSAGRQFGQLLLTLAMLPHEAYRSLEAILRTLYRLLVTHRRLLDWKTSTDTGHKNNNGLTPYYLNMWASPFLAFITGLSLLVFYPANLLVAFPLLVLWMVAPLGAWILSQPIRLRPPDLSKEQVTFLRLAARRTWHYFEAFVTAEENWLPPDNFQEVPVPTIASRTSPTNMGLALLSNLAAHDLGYLPTEGLLQRTRNTLATLQRLERAHGHFYNWYETRSLKPLLPLYISSVDSGNLAGHLLTLGAGLRQLADQPIFGLHVFEGLRDTVDLLKKEVRSGVLFLQIDAELSKKPSTLLEARRALQQIAQLATHIFTTLKKDTAEIKEWSQILKRSAEDHLADLLFLTPWLTPFDREPALTPSYGMSAGPEPVPTLREIAENRYLPSTTSCGFCASSEPAQHHIIALESLAQQCDSLAVMDFTFLFDPARELFCTGVNITEHRRDAGFYDLLASEARLCSYVAIALGQVPQDHWFSLGRLLVASRGDASLVSWSGSMFEYLMPLLVMPNYVNTLLDYTCRSAVKQQIAYGHLRGVPWGISESGYNRTDVLLNYQYRAFGVPGLGLKRGLAEDIVIAPYATMMALAIAPRSACENLQRLTAEGCTGKYGFYEAVDYTPSRLPPDETRVIIRSYMAHHQGMSLLALDNVLKQAPMQRRFMACPLLKAANLLLQEQVPQTAASVYIEDLELETSKSIAGEGEEIMRVSTTPTPATPEVHLLSNGNYHVAISSAGGGYSRWRDLAVTRWREDATRDCWGTFIYLRDLGTGEFWSSTYQPTLRTTSSYEAIFTQARAEFRQCHASLEIHTEISVSPEDDVELRRITITNRSSNKRHIELTSYAEVVLALQSSDTSHPAFNNLFVQTDYVKASSALFCTRRARSKEERPPWLFHMMVGQGGEQGALTCETDRARFIGRNGTLSNPLVLQNRLPLSGTVGSVLDPIVSLRRTVTLLPHETAIIDCVLGVSESQDLAQGLVEKYQSSRMADRALDLAWTHNQVTLRHLNVTEAEAQLYGRLAGALIYADTGRRPNSTLLRSNRRGQSGLWSYGISGDAPIILLRISDGAKIEIVQQLIQAHSYWRMKGLTVELVILNENISIYHQSLHEHIVRLISSGVEAQMLDKPGGIFIRRLEQVSQDDRILLQAVARIVLSDENGTLADQLAHRNVLEPLIPTFVPTRSQVSDTPPPLPSCELHFGNGLGGFTPDGSEYVITLQPEQRTPAPWVNVIANRDFGTVVSESGSAYTWMDNAHEFRLTPWNNDPVQDISGEVFYIRDEETGQFWSPTPSPVSNRMPTVIRHGFGYTVFEHVENGIAAELWVYVAIDAPVKFTVLKLRNQSGRRRRLSLTGYWEWVLGDLRQNNLLHVQTEVDIKTGALLARNYYNREYHNRIVFLDVNDTAKTLTGDRKEFIGRNGTLSKPLAMKRVRLSGRTGAGLDPCGALQVTVELMDGEERETTFRLGVGRNMDDLQHLIQRFRRVDSSRQALDAVKAYWIQTLGTVQVETPDPSVNIMANGWLLYQTLSCRLWGRTGFYQSGGAYGFRDQLQDVMALIHAAPTLTREHLLLAASHQFSEGDVQHWWHPPSGQGVRTHFSDDYLWLPYVTCHYVTHLNDQGILDEKVPFLEGRPVKPEEESYYDRPNRCEGTATLYQHCKNAIEHGMTFGEHGLPLMGCGDWNDGMNRVGNQGRGESVWLGFFFYDVLMKFSAVASTRLDTEFAERCMIQAHLLQQHLEHYAWDGQWYLRAFFDNGEPLGSKENSECQIDSLPQSWSVISGGGNPARSREALKAVEARLIHRDVGLIQLFDPPFKNGPLDPGYIKGYIPGVRENGGHYTHGAIWTALAFALTGDSERAWELFKLINPIHHGDTSEKIGIYKVEPYVVAADIYSVSPHTGRGGWTWYTGSAGWYYRLLIETLLGIHREGETLRFSPLMPKAWTSFTIHYRYQQTMYHLLIQRLPSGSIEKEGNFLDGQAVPDNRITLKNDRGEHTLNCWINA